MDYRTNRKIQFQKNLERLAEEEALDHNALAQIVQDIEIYSKAQEAEVRLRTKGLNLIEREDRDEARKYVDDLIKKTEKNAKERKKKWGKRMNLAAKVASVSVVVLPTAYAIYSLVGKYVEKQEVEERTAQIKTFNEGLSARLVEAADIDCDGILYISEFNGFYKKAAGEHFFYSDFDYHFSSVEFNFEDTKSIAVKKLSAGYQITMPSQFAEKLLQKGSNPSCSINLE